MDEPKLSRRYNRVLFSRPLHLPEGTPGEGNDELGFIYNLGRCKSWPRDKSSILSEYEDKLIDLTLQFEQAREEYNVEWKDKEQSHASLKAASELQKLERKLEIAGRDESIKAARVTVAYLIDHVETPFTEGITPLGDKPDTWVALDPALIDWLIDPLTIAGVLEELDGPLSMHPFSTPLTLPETDTATTE